MRRPTGFGTSTLSGSNGDVGYMSSSSNTPTATTKPRRQRASTMLKQDSIAEEPLSRSPSPCPPLSASSTNYTNNFPPHSRHPSTGSQISTQILEQTQQQTSPRLSRSRLATYSPERKLSLSPNACPSSSHSLYNTPNASTKRRGFQRASSTAQSDVISAFLV